jgi:prolyl oligopeptidase
VPTQQLPASALLAASLARDPYLWLEESHGDPAIAWVKSEDANTVAVLEGDPRYASKRPRIPGRWS